MDPVARRGHLVGDLHHDSARHGGEARLIGLDQGAGGECRHTAGWRWLARHHPFVERHQERAHGRHGIVRIARVDVGSGIGRGAGAAAMLGAGDHVDAGILGQRHVPLAERIGVQQRGALLPVFGRGIGLDQLGIRAVAAQQRAFFAGERVGERRGREREFVLREAMILVLGAGARRLAERRIEKDTADAGDVRMDAVEDLAARFVAVETLGDVIAQVAAGLGEADGQRMADLAAGCGGRGRIVAQPADDVTGGGEAQPQHLGIPRLIVEFVEIARLRLGAVAQLDRAGIDEGPLVEGQLMRLVIGALAHR